MKGGMECQSLKEEGLEEQDGGMNWLTCKPADPRSYQFLSCAIHIFQFRSEVEVEIC